MARQTWKATDEDLATAEAVIEGSRAAAELREKWRKAGLKASTVATARNELLEALRDLAERTDLEPAAKQREDALLRERLIALQKTVALSQSEGWYQDDESPTVANLRARFGPGAVILSASRLPVLFALAAELDRRRGAARAPGALSYADAAHALVSEALNEGRLASDDARLGLVFAHAAPDWARDNAQLRAFGEWRDGIPSDHQEVDLNNAQARRWRAIEAGLGQLLDAKVRGVPVPPDHGAHHWEPVASLGEWGMERRFRYGDATNGAFRAVRERAAVRAGELRAELAARQSEMLSGAAPVNPAALEALRQQHDEAVRLSSGRGE